MRIIYYELDSYLEKKVPSSVAAIGFFDGLHLGHQQLVNKTLEVAKTKSLSAALITFWPSPASVLGNQKEELLTTIDERIEIAKQLGIELFIVIRFSKSLSQLSPDDFYKKIIKKLNVKHLVCGDDFRYGYRGSGSVETLKLITDLGLSVIYDYKLANERVSSTLIKAKLKAGEVEVASKLLDRPYMISGYVKHGRKKGRTIGFPTLNLDYKDNKILVADGVYVGVTKIKGQNYISTINVGHNPTINTVLSKSIESYVHNYNEDTYYQRVEFKFIKRIRPEIKFDNVEALIETMNKDIEYSEKYFDAEKRRRFKIEVIWISW